MKTVVVAAGDLSYGERERQLLRGADRVIAADGGLDHCVALGVWPHLVVGDLDSASPDLIDEAVRRGTAVARHPRDKNHTDLELALQSAIEFGASSIEVLAVFGGRLDHALGNVAVVTAVKLRSVNVTVRDGAWTMTVLHGPGTEEFAVLPGQVVSLLPRGADASGVSTSGLRWPLDRETLAVDEARGVSNSAVAAVVTVSIESGCLLVVCGPPSQD